MNTYLKSISLALIGLPCVASADRPNIVIMMVDDMGIGDTSAYLGRSLMPASPPIELTQRTPSLDDFAKRSIVFTDAHAGASMCSSSRYSLLTGRFGHRPYLKRQGWLPHGPNQPMIQPELVTLPEMLKEKGYRTACVGKYHVGMAFDNGSGKPATDYYHKDVDFTKPLLDGPTDHGFDEFLGVPGNTEDALDTEPRIYIRNNRWTFTERDKMVPAGHGRHAGKLVADPAWDLLQIGPVYLAEVEKFLGRSSRQKDPFFLYYVPNANHQQMGETGRYAVPKSINGQPVSGAARLTNGEPAGQRGDMVLENDIAFGRVIELLETLPDPREPGRKLIDNTLVIFTSDNGPNEGQQDAPSYQSGGLRGKKAKITEGGLRIPFLLYWKGHFEGGTVNRTHFALTDLYATFANLLGHQLGNADAQDSYNVLDHWSGTAKSADTRPRLKFCNLGSPFVNDAMSIREKENKVIVEGGVAEPHIRKGNRGAVTVARYHDLYKDPAETRETWSTEDDDVVRQLGEKLLELHNRGHARELAEPQENQLVLDDGWHNLRNDLDGAIGFEFRLDGQKGVTITHLGMWDDHRDDAQVRPATDPPSDHITERPSRGGKARGLDSAHRIELSTGGRVVAGVNLVPGDKDMIEGEFRYAVLSPAVKLTSGVTYRLTMSTSASDGDSFHNPASYDGLSPITHSGFRILRSVLIREGREAPIASFFEATQDYWKHRLPVGPTLKFK